MSAHFHRAVTQSSDYVTARWPAATPQIVKDFTEIERTVERVFVTDLGECPSVPALSPRSCVHVSACQMILLPDLLRNLGECAVSCVLTEADCVCFMSHSILFLYGS